MALRLSYPCGRSRSGIKTLYTDLMTRKHHLYLPIITLLLALGASGWYGYRWHAAPHWTRAGLEKAVHLNVTVEQSPHARARGGNKANAGNQPDQIPQQIQARLVERLNRGWRRARMAFFISLGLTVLAALLVVFRVVRPPSAGG